MTPDGIATEDWARVHELSLDVVNASSRDDYKDLEQARKQLQVLLDQLQDRYGPLPSLLATRADYVEDSARREYWLLLAFAEAERLGDKKNLTLISHSLADYYLEHAPDERQATFWLDRLENCLKDHFEAFEAKELARLRSRLETRE
jgi:hypothetical protein